MAKKEETKKEVLKPIKAQKVGKNLILVVDGKKLVKPNITEKDLTSIGNKVKLYNKKPTEAAKKVIMDLVDIKVTEKATKEAAKKGVKKLVKKAIKKSKTSSKKVKEDKKTIDTLTQEILDGKTKKEDLSPENIAALELLLENAKKVAEKVEPKAEQSTNKRSGEH